MRNMKKKYDLAIAYRIYPRITKPVVGYPDDKLKLSELCLLTLKEALGSLKVKLWVLLDKCPEEYTLLFQKYFPAEDLRLIHLKGIGNQATFGLQIYILTHQTDAEFVYFAEDDYFFLPDAFPRMLSLMRHNSDVHFVSAYEHPDYYTLFLHPKKYQIKIFEDQRWRTTIGTTCSFLSTKTILIKTADVFNTYYKERNYDVSLWMSLTKANVLNPVRIGLFILKYRDFFKMTARSWIHCSKQILFGKRWNLWVAHPSLATHMEKKTVAPFVEWESKFEIEKQKMR
jgi:hypothetical protein